MSDETKRRILRAADELGYRPNAIARSLIMQRSRIIALLFSYLDNPFYALALEKLCLALQLSGHHALVFMMPNTLVDTEDTVAELIDYQVDGIITASVELSSGLVKLCKQRGVPIVMFNRVQDVPGTSAVATDNIEGGRVIARYLVKAGHERIALLGGWAKASTNRDREFGFRAELADMGQKPWDYARGDFDLPTTVAATRQLFDKPAQERPDAVFVTNDYMALEAMGVLRYQLGLKIPDDVSVIGFDDVPRAAAPEFSLTTFRQQLEQMVELSVELLLKDIASDEPSGQRLSLAGQLIERGSARRPL